MDLYIYLSFLVSLPIENCDKEKSLGLDIVEGFFASGLITAVQKEYADATRSRETMQFLEQYKKAMANRTEEQKAAERAEVRAAFGNEATIVNIITGEVV